jgi:mRNA-degrading endonuclease YafQ of YafQ-DinJ toxin-antitoxin module
MSNIKFFATTDLFWQTLGEYAGHALFPLMRKKIKDCVHRKLQNPNFRNGRDKPFDVDPRLAGIWHCKLSEEIDAVLFYKIHGDTLFLTMVGSHHDYPADGKNSAKAAPLAEKNRNAVAAGHVDYPARKTLKWSRPKDLIGNPLLEEIDRDELYSIREALRVENDEATIFQRLFDKDIMDASEEEFDGWMRELVVAHIEIERALRRIDLSAISRRDRREISSLAVELEIDPEEILQRDGQGFTIELFVEAVRTGIEAQERISGGAKRSAQIVDDFEDSPADNAQRLLTLARRLVVDLSRKTDFADSAAHEVERLLVLAEVVLSDPDCAEMQNYAESKAPGLR